MNYKKNGTSYMGTGFVVDDNLILTAAHCMYNATYDYAATDVTYTLYNVNGTVNATHNAASYHVPLNYINDGSDNWDYALIVVNEDLSDYRTIDLGIARDKLKNNTSSSIYLNYTSKLGIYVTGFAYNNNNNITEYTGIGNLVSPYLSNQKVLYGTDTDGGESGGPVYVKTSSGDMIAIGIHNGKSTSTYNKGRRIDTNILQFVYNNPNI